MLRHLRCERQREAIITPKPEGREEEAGLEEPAVEPGGGSCLKAAITPGSAASTRKRSQAERD